MPTRTFARALDIVGESHRQRKTSSMRELSIGLGRLLLNRAEIS